MDCITANASLSLVKLSSCWLCCSSCFCIVMSEIMKTNLSEECVCYVTYISCVCVCLAHFRRRLSGRDHQCVHSVSAAGGFLPGVEDVFGHAAGWRRRKPGEEPAGVRCELHLTSLFY